VLGHYEPEIHALLAGGNAINQAHDGMLDEETGLRGFIVTDDPVFLAPYYQGKDELLDGDSAALVLATHSGLVGEIVSMRVAEEDWISSWAIPALTFPNSHNTVATVESFLLSGKNLFDAYRATNSAVSTAVNADIAGEQAQEHQIVLIALAHWPSLSRAATIARSARRWSSR